MTDLKLVELVKKLESKTSAGELKWKEVKDEDNEFQTTIASFVITISRDHDRSDDSTLFDYVLILRNSDGETLDIIDDDELSMILHKRAMVTDNAYEIMTSIYGNAMRNAKGVDKVIDDVLKELGD